MTRRRLAAPVGLAVAAVVFALVFLFSHSLLWSPLLAALAAVGGYLMLDDRSATQASSDDYAEDAHDKVEQVLRSVAQIQALAREVAVPAAQASLRQACQTVPELLTRVRTTSPDSLYSSASQLGAHLTSLLGVVQQYLDIQRKPAFYPDSQALLRSGEDAFARFSEFALDSVRLVSEGDVAQYRANLATVAPPKLPELGS